MVSPMGRTGGDLAGSTLAWPGRIEGSPYAGSRGSAADEVVPGIHFGSARAHPGRSGFLKPGATISFRAALRWRSRCGLEGRAPNAP